MFTSVYYVRMTLIGNDTGTRLLSLATGTVTTAGTPVQLASGRCKYVVIESDVDNGSIGSGAALFVGDSTVDALSDPPVAAASIYPTQREKFNCVDSSEIYVDATENGAKFTYARFG